MQIRNLNGRTMAELNGELSAGGRFISYQCCFSFLIFSFRPSSDFYFLPCGKSAFWQSLPYTLATLLLGWWSLPWGPMHTLGVLQHNLNGGTDVTELAVKILLLHQQAGLQMDKLHLQAVA